MSCTQDVRRPGGECELFGGNSKIVITFPEGQPALTTKAAYTLNHSPHAVCTAYWNDVLRPCAFLKHRSADHVTPVVSQARGWIAGGRIVVRVCEVQLLVIGFAEL